MRTLLDVLTGKAEPAREVFGPVSPPDRDVPRQREPATPRVPNPMDALSVQFDVAPNWMRSAFRLASQLLPNRMRLPDVQPVTEVHRPKMERHVIPDPAAGADITFDFDGEAERELIGFYFELVTDANAANRLVEIIVFAGEPVSPREGIVATTLGNVSQVASTSRAYYYAATGVIGETSSVPATRSVILLPAPFNLRIPPRGRIRTLTNAIQATDQYQKLCLYTRRTA